MAVQKIKEKRILIGNDSLELFRKDGAGLQLGKNFVVADFGAKVRLVPKRIFLSEHGVNLFREKPGKKLRLGKNMEAADLGQLPTLVPAGMNEKGLVFVPPWLVEPERYPMAAKFLKALNEYYTLVAELRRNASLPAFYIKTPLLDSMVKNDPLPSGERAVVEYIKRGEMGENPYEQREFAGKIKDGKLAEEALECGKFTDARAIKILEATIGGKGHSA